VIERVRAVAWLEAKRRVRDRLGLAVSLIAPAGLLVLVTLALGSQPRLEVTVALVDHDGGPLASALRDQVLQGPELEEVVTVRDVQDETTARSLLRNGGADAAVIIPRGYSTAVLNAEPTALTVERGVTSGQAAEVAESVAYAFGSSVEGAQLGAALAGRQGNAALIARQAAAARSPVAVDPVDAAPIALFLIPGIVMMMLFFVGAQTAEATVEDRDDGVLARVLSAPVRPGEVLLGKGGVAFIHGLASTSLAVAAVWFIAPSMTIASPPLALLLGATAVASVVGLSLGVACIARTRAQAYGLLATIAFAAGFGSGTLLPPGQLPSAFRTIGAATPNGWALRGVESLVQADAQVATSAVASAVLVAFASAGCLVGLVGLRQGRRLL
jgi:ABC-2 type transport system permease protein